MALPVPKPRTPTQAYASSRYGTAGGLHKMEKGQDMPVFDRNHPRGEAEVRAGLTPRMSGLAGVSFARTERDRRQGTPVTAQLMGDPAPDRLAVAEALRQQLLAKTNRFKIKGSEDRIKLRGAYDNRAQNMSKTPDTPKPLGYYVDIAPEDAALEARRGDDVLYFLTRTDAARCLTGVRGNMKAVKAIENASSGVTMSAFGWTWTRLKSRRGKNR